MRLFLPTLFTVTALATAPVTAADLFRRAAPPIPAPLPAFTWTGFYLGANAGYALLDGDATSACVNPIAAINGVGCPLPFRAKSDPSGFAGGGQIGYNHQLSPGSGFVIGVEADLQYTDLHSSDVAAGRFPIVSAGLSTNDVFSFRQRLDYFGTVRARIGYAFDRVLVYGMGGLAYGDVQLASTVVTATNLGFFARGDGVRAGWTVGGGVEYAFTDNLSAKLEGLYFDIGDRTVLGPEFRSRNGFALGATFETEGALIRAGLNYRLSLF